MSEKYIYNLLNRYKKDINIGNNNTYFLEDHLSINLYYFIDNNNNLIPKNDKLVEYSKFYLKIIVAKELEYNNNEEEDLIVNEIQIIEI